MVTNYPRQLAAGTAANRTAPASAATLFGRMFSRLGQVLCGLRGHDSILHFEANRVMMRCTSCGHDTPGWEITGRGPRKRFDGDAHRHLLVPKRLVLRKSA